MDIQSYRDYRAILKYELERRASVNSQYSLRAFARDLKLSPQMLSFVLNRKKSLSPDVAADIAQRLNLDPEEASHFLDLVMLADSRSESMKKVIEYRIENRKTDSNASFRNLDFEAFKVIADWHHFAILELSLTADFNSDAKWISERLGTSVFHVNQALERLKKLELIEEDKKGQLRKTEVNITATYGAPSSALRKLAKQLLEKAADSLETQAQDERDITNITMAIDPSLLPEAKKMITQFRRKLCAYLEQGERSEVYTFAPSLFRITKKIKEIRK